VRGKFGVIRLHEKESAGVLVGRIRGGANFVSWRDA
jgi:hypothetical protein